MDLLRACAARLEAGEPAEAVMATLRARYTTPRCLSVKTCLVRGLCAQIASSAKLQEALIAQARGDSEDALERFCVAAEYDEAEKAAAVSGEGM